MGLARFAIVADLSTSQLVWSILWFVLFAAWIAWLIWAVVQSIRYGIAKGDSWVGVALLLALCLLLPFLGVVVVTILYFTAFRPVLRERASAEDAMPPPGPYPAGWYPDPADATCEWYWDGASWTDRRTSRLQPGPSDEDAESTPPGR